MKALVFILISVLSLTAFSQTNLTFPNLPQKIEFSEKGEKLIFYPGTESCPEDLEQYLHVLDSKKLSESYKKYQKRNSTLGDTGFVLGFLGLMTESAALGQIGQDDGRGKIYAVSGGIALLTGVILMNVQKKLNGKRLAKVIKIYNETVSAKASE